jgi:hypothetical protein
MREVAQLLNDMLRAGVIGNYAMFGAVAQMRYTQPVATLDADVLVSLPAMQDNNVLDPICHFCRSRGYNPEGEAILVGDWPVQFIPAFSRLTEEAIDRAETGEIGGLPLRVVRADYLAAIALSVGRAKDFARVLSLLEADAVSSNDIERLCARHDLISQWQQFRRRFLDA